MTEKKTRFSGLVATRGKLPVEPEPEPEPVPPPVSTATPAPITPLKMGRPPGKKTDPNYTQVTVYLRKDVHNAARKLLFDDRRQFSDLVDDLVSRWIADSRKA